MASNTKDRLRAQGEANVLSISFNSRNCICTAFNFFSYWIGSFIQAQRSFKSQFPLVRLKRCRASLNVADEGVTYAKKVGEQLQGLGRGIVNIPPVVGWHAGRPLLRGPIVQEVGQQLGG